MAINVYGLLSDHSSCTRLAGALCHPGFLASQPYVILWFFWGPFLKLHTFWA